MEIIRAAESRVARATESLAKMRAKHAEEVTLAEKDLAREESILSLARLDGSGDALAVLLEREVAELRRMDADRAFGKLADEVSSGAFLEPGWAETNREWFAGRMREEGFQRAILRIRANPEADAKFVALFPEHAGGKE